jgi:hypothetical protein
MKRSASFIVPAFLVLVGGCGGDRADDADASRDLATPVVADMATPVVTPDPFDLAMPSSSPDAHPPAPPYVPVDGGGTLGVVELVSPAVCATKDGFLVKCDFGQPAVAAPLTTDPSPWSTTVTTHEDGNCTSRYPMELALVADADPEVYFEPFNPSLAITVRHPDRSRIATLHVRNASKWQPYAAYDTSCRIWIEVAFNAHDPL